MVEKSLIDDFSTKKLKNVKKYLFLVKYEALKAEDFLEEHFRYDEIRLILTEVMISGGAEELDKKLDRIKIRNHKKKKNNLNSKLDIEEFGPFPREVEDILRENVIDNMDDLLNTDLSSVRMTTDAKDFLEFMKRFYDFSHMEGKVKQLTKSKKNSKINREINEEEE